MRTIERDELKTWLDEGRTFALVEVLGPEAFQHFHLPGAINVPLRAGSFEQAIQRAVGDRRAPVVVYSQDTACAVSREAAEILDRLGYAQVLHYAGGKVEWQQAGMPTEQHRK
jgi:rhodanese-related sulfurtransferase